MVDFLRSWRAGLRRWPVIAAATLGMTAVGALFASCGTTTYTAQGNVHLRENPYAALPGEIPALLPTAWSRSASPGFLRSHAVLERAVKEGLRNHFPSSTEGETGTAIAQISSTLTARAENHSNVLTLSYSDPRMPRAVAVVNAVAKAFEELARERLAQGIASTATLLEKTLREREEELAKTQKALHELGPASKESQYELEEQAYLAELSRLERESSAARVEAESLGVEIDLLMSRADRGQYGAPAPADTRESDRISRDVEAARRELAELRSAHPEIAPPVAQAAQRVERLRRERDDAVRRETARAQFAPVRALLDSIREKTVRRDRQAQAANQLQVQVEEARKRLRKHEEQRGAPPHADERSRQARRQALEAESQRLSASLAPLRAQFAQLSAAKAMVTSPVDRIDPARAAVGSVTLTFRGLPFYALLGLVLGSAGAFLIGHASSRLRTEEDVRRYVNLPLLGVLPEVAQEERILLRADPKGALAETFGTAAAVVESLARPPQAKLLLVTGSRPGEGKSTVACNLATSLARAGSRVLILDADLRRGVQHLFFVVQNDVGLSAFLQGSVETADLATVPTEVATLNLLPSGAYPENPVPFLRCDRFKALLAEMKEKFDFVIVDAPPVLDLADALVLAPLVDGVLVVISSGETGKDELTDAKRRLRSAGGKLLGCLLNKATTRSRGYYYYSSEAVAIED